MLCLCILQHSTLKIYINIKWLSRTIAKVQTSIRKCNQLQFQLHFIPTFWISSFVEVFPILALINGVHHSFTYSNSHSTIYSLTHIFIIEQPFSLQTKSENKHRETWTDITLLIILLTIRLYIFVMSSATAKDWRNPIDKFPTISSLK